MLKLGVNIDHTATLREARYRGQPEGEPDPIKAALLCIDAGCHGITAHLREDRRHIQDNDIDRLISVLTVPLNFEIANTPEMIAKALEIKPDFPNCWQQVGTQHFKIRYATCRVEVRTYSTHHKKVPMCKDWWRNH